MPKINNWDIKSICSTLVDIKRLITVIGKNIRRVSTRIIKSKLKYKCINFTTGWFWRYSLSSDGSFFMDETVKGFQSFLVSYLLFLGHGLA